MKTSTDTSPLSSSVLAGMLASAGHDIRGYVTPLVNALELIRMVTDADPDVATALALAERQIKALVDLASRLHDCSVAARVVDGDGR